MHERKEELTAAAEAASPESRPSWGTDSEFRSDLAFPKLSDAMLQRLGPYGQEASFPKDTCLYTYGDRDTDMLVILAGEVESRLLVEGGGSKRERSAIQTAQRRRG